MNHYLSGLLCLDVNVTGNCIGIGNGYWVRYLGMSKWRERKTLKRDEHIKSNGQCSNGIYLATPNKIQLPSFCLISY